MCRKILCFLVALMLCGLGPPVPAFAQPNASQLARAEVINARARAAFAQKKYEEAAELFLAAYELSGSPGTLFNAARAMQQAGKLREARELFHLFRSKTRDTKGVADADAQLRLIDAELLRIETAEKQPKPKDPSPPPKDKSVVVVELPKPPTPTILVKVQQPPKKAEPPLKLEKRFTPERLVTSWKSYAAIGALASGVGLMLGGQSIGNDANQRAIQSLEDKRAYQEAFATGNSLWWTGLGLTIASTGLSAWAITDAWATDMPRKK